MNKFPDIFYKMMEQCPEVNSNTHVLKMKWDNYISETKSAFPEITIDDSGTTVSLGEISPGCSHCKNGNWDCNFLTSTCNLNCKFCISPFSSCTKINASAYGDTDQDILNNYRKVPIKGISFSGGEPFMNFSDVITRLKVYKQAMPNNYFWLYTNGVLVREEHIDILVDAGLNEIRYNTAATGYNDSHLLKMIEYSAKTIKNVAVEIPVIVKEKKRLLNAIRDYENAGVTYLNLHELIRELHTPSSNLKNENFEKYTFEDGHETGVSLDSRIVVNEVIRKMIEEKSSLNLNFCSTVNKLRQLRKRRNNMLRLLKNPHEKIIDEEYLETILILKENNTWQFVHPDALSPDHFKLNNFSAFRFKRIGPLSVFINS